MIWLSYYIAFALSHSKDKGACVSHLAIEQSVVGEQQVHSLSLRTGTSTRAGAGCQLPGTSSGYRRRCVPPEPREALVHGPIPTRVQSICASIASSLSNVCLVHAWEE